MNIRLLINSINQSNYNISIVSCMDMDLKKASFTPELIKATKSTKWSDTVGGPSNNHQPRIKEGPDHTIQGNLFKFKNSHACLLEFQNHLFYFFTTETTQQKSKAQFKMTIYVFAKEDGNHGSYEVNELKGTPSCINAGLMSIIIDEGDKSQMVDQGRKLRKYRVMVTVGLKEGYIKLIEFNPKERKYFKPILSSHKIEQKIVASITIPDKSLYDQKNICYLLFEDSKIIIFNFLSKQIIAIFQPPTLGHDLAVCFSLHPSGNYFASCSKSGQIFFWHLNEETIKAIQKSEEISSVPKKKTKKIGNKQIVEIDDEDLETETYTFKTKDRVISVFPFSMLHSASISGLKWIGFMGNLIAMITRTGVFKLIAINFDYKDEFVTLIEYPIENGQAISSIQLFPQEQRLIVTKPKYYVKIGDSDKSKGKSTEDYIKWKEDMLKKNEQNYRSNYNSFEPGILPQSSIEVLNFSSQLKIDSIMRLTVINERKTVDFTTSLFDKKHQFGLFNNGSRFYIANCVDLIQ